MKPNTPTHTPTSWQELQSCPCEYCGRFRRMYDRLAAHGCHLAVFDMRMVGQGFSVADLRKLFRGPAKIESGHATSWSAVGAARRLGQEHVGLLLSNYPKRPTIWRLFVLEPVGSIV